MADVPAGFPNNEITQFITQTARQLGIDPAIALRVAQSEGGVTEPARRGTFATGSSWWPFQLHYGGRGTPYESYGTTAGMGNSFTASTGWNPGDPGAWQASVIYALNAAKQQGWGAWYGAAAQGITGFMGIDRSHPLGALPLPLPGSGPTPHTEPTGPVATPRTPAPTENGGLPNIVTLPETTVLPEETLSPGATINYPGGSFTLPPIKTQPITFNPTGLVNTGGRLFLSILAVGFIAFGIIVTVWDKTPDATKRAAKTAVEGAVAA